MAKMSGPLRSRRRTCRRLSTTDEGLYPGRLEGLPGGAQRRAQRRRARAVPGDVADDDREALVAPLEDVDEVAAQLETMLSRPGVEMHVQAGKGDRHGREEAALETPVQVFGLGLHGAPAGLSERHIHVVAESLDHGEKAGVRLLMSVGPAEHQEACRRRRQPDGRRQQRPESLPGILICAVVDALANRRLVAGGEGAKDGLSLFDGSPCLHVGGEWQPQATADRLLEGVLPQDDQLGGVDVVQRRLIRRRRRRARRGRRRARSRARPSRRGTRG